MGEAGLWTEEDLRELRMPIDIVDPNQDNSVSEEHYRTIQKSERMARDIVSSIRGREAFAHPTARADLRSISLGVIETLAKGFRKAEQSARADADGWRVARMIVETEITKIKAQVDADARNEMREIRSIQVKNLTGGSSAG